MSEAARRNPQAMRTALRWLATWALAVTAVWTVSRLVLVMLASTRWSSADLPTLFVTGLRVDLIGTGVLLALPVLLWPLLVHERSARLWWRTSRGWIGTIAIAALVLELISPAYMLEYEARPNHLAVEYLRDWDSVLPMLWTGFRVPLLLGLGALVVGIVGLANWLRRPVPSAKGSLAVLLVWPLLLAGTVYMIRNSFDHRPANPAMFASWNDQLLNQLALNSSYSFGYAVYAQRHERSAEDVYGDVGDGAVRAALHQDPRFLSAPVDEPTRHRILPTAPRAQPFNLIVVVEESLGADFSGRLGGQGLTPQLDRWGDRGIWFDQLYATGTRSARGLEAIVAGFPPSPAPAILKREGAQDGFATLASVLDAYDYQSRFIYGGGAHFDNMRGFFLGNGFDAVIERRDFPAPVHVGSWGVSDEDLFDRALEETDAASARGEHYFHLVFSSSHHEPFDIPAGRLPPDLDAPGTQIGAVRYADYALGRFLDAAAQRPWFDNTVVMVVADHDVRVYGDDIIPLRRFQIPGLITGAGIAARKVQSLASQIDLAPTLLSLMGIEAEVPFPGRDLTASLPEFGITNGPQPRALMQFDDRFAWLTTDELRVLLPQGRGERWQLSSTGLLPGSPMRNSEVDALRVQAVLGDWLYRNKAYRVVAARGGPSHLVADR